MSTEAGREASWIAPSGPTLFYRLWVPDSCRALALPETERAAREVLSVPLHPHLDDDTVRFVAESTAELG